MRHPLRRDLRALVVATFGLVGVLGAQQFVSNTTDVPQGAPGNLSATEQVDFGDVDLDGDWDAAFADGGDVGNDQNRLWINQGGLQSGTVGFFVDETAARMPAVNDSSRDLEFADLDGDLDLDLFVSNDSGTINNASRFLINLGGPDGGTVGFFDDQTSTRWVGLGDPGSSVPPSSVLPGGGFITFCSDSDFADVDADGDLDLVHSSHGVAYGGQAPTRLFLNDGAGFFTEFNPSGFQLAGTNISNGDPGLWCQGTQMDNTTDASGAHCDIALSTVDLEIGDVDGDLDLDVLLGSVGSPPRFFTNLLAETGSLAFRDTSTATFPPNWSVGGNAYDQEFGDLDGDADIDLYGLNWSSFDDTTLKNSGGVFEPPVPVGGSGADAEEADFIDYDGDGDLDVYVANFSGSDSFSQNVGGSLQTLQPVEGTDITSRDGEVADLDADGDYDVVATGGSSPEANVYLENQTPGATDEHAPYFGPVESVAGGVADATPRSVRAQVYDNAPYYVTWYHETYLEVTVDGGPPLAFPMASSGGQVFRGEIPGQLVGSVSYRVVSTDEHGNTGSSATRAYVATQGACDSSVAVYCTAKLNSLGCLPAIQIASCVSASDESPSYVTANMLRNQKTGLLFYGFGQAALPFLGGTLCVAPPLLRTPPQTSGGSPPPADDCSGGYAFDMNAEVQGGPTPPLTPGTTVFGQYWARDPGASSNASLSNAVQFTVQP